MLEVSRHQILAHRRKVSAGGTTTDPSVGSRYSAFVIAEDDLALFTLGRLPDGPSARKRAEDVAERLETTLGDERLDVREAAGLVGVHPNALRYAAPTGRFLIYWDGARQPLIWRVPAPAVDPFAARLALARRFLHTFGPATAESFASWAGIRANAAGAAFEALTGELSGNRCRAPTSKRSRQRPPPSPYRI